MQWIQAKNDEKYLPKNEESIPLLIDGKYDLGYHSEPRKLFVTNNHGEKPYRLVKWLSVSEDQLKGMRMDMDMALEREKLLLEQIELLKNKTSQPSSPVPEDVKVAAKIWSDEVLQWNIQDDDLRAAIMKEKYDSFLAGHDYKGQQGVEIDDLQRQVKEHIKNYKHINWYEFLSENEMDYLVDLFMIWNPLFNPGSVGFEEQKRHIEKHQPTIPLSVIEVEELQDKIVDIICENIEEDSDHTLRGTRDAAIKITKLLQSQPK